MAATTPPDSSEPATQDTVVVDTVVVDTVVLDTTVMDTMATDSGGSASSSAAPATIYDDNGNAVASVTVVGSEMETTDYEEGNDPDAGKEYLRVTVSVMSETAEGNFGVNVDDFILQNNNGFVTTGETVATAAQAAAGEDVTSDADLANGESVELTVTFQVTTGVGPRAVFYRPDDERLIDVADFS